MGSKKTTEQTSNQTQTNAPPSWTASGLSDVASRVNDALKNVPTTAYTGPMVAQGGDTQGVLDAYRSAAATSNDMSSFVRGQLPGLTAAPTFNTSLPTGRYDVGTGADLTPAINAAIHPVFKQLQEQVLPGIRSSALESGAYSGDRAMSVVPGQAIRDSNESAQRIAAELAYTDYQAREERRLRGFTSDEDRALAGFNADTSRQLGVGDLLTQRMGLMPDLVDTIMRASGGGADMTRIANDYGTASDQAAIDDALAREQYNVMRPFMGLDIASQLLRQVGDGYGTNTMSGKSTTVEKTGGWGPILQGALGLGAAALGFPGVGSALGLASGAAKAAVPMASSVFGRSGVPAFGNG